MSDSPLERYLADHPQMTGVLFSTFLLLSNVGAVLAGHGTATPGP